MMNGDIGQDLPLPRSFPFCKSGNDYGFSLQAIVKIKEIECVHVWHYAWYLVMLNKFQ